MKVQIDIDEEWPVYTLDFYRPGFAATEIELDDETVEYILDLQQRYDELQKKLKKIYELHHGEV